MTPLNILAQTMFTVPQLVVIIVLSVVLAELIILNIILFYLYNKIKERRLCTDQLQNKREELLRKLEEMRLYGVGEEGEEEEQLVLPVVDEIEEQEELEEEQIDESEDDDDADEFDENAVTLVAEGDEADGELNAEILAVRDMSAATRERLGFVGEEYNRKRYYVRYTLGFEAKLRESEPEVQQRYKTLVDEIGLYKGVKIKESFKQQRIYKGRKTLGLVMFRGKTLCVAFALNPADYAETKYRGIDKSDKKRFEKTPMLFRISSDRKAEYSKYLLLQIADNNTILLNETPVEREYDFEKKSRDEMFVERKLNITVLGEAPELDEDEWIEQPAEEPVEEPVQETLEELIEEVAEQPEEELIEENEEEPVEEVAEETEDEVEELTEEVTVTNDAGEEVVIIRRIRYNRSFTARITQARDEVKDWYSELKNELLSYKKVKSSISWKRERFSIGRNTFASLVVRGKTLCLCLATDPKRFDDTKYKVIDLSVRSPKSKLPCMYRISSERRVKYAKQMIAMIMQELGLDIPETFASENYVMPYRTTEALIDDGLIRIIGGENASADAPFSLSYNRPEEQPAEEVVEEQPVEEPVPEEQPAEEAFEETAIADETVEEEQSEEVVEEEQPEEEQLPERDFEILEEVDVSEADVMSDEDAEQLVEEKVINVKKRPKKRKRGIVNINVLSANFEAGAHVTIAELHEKKLIPADVNFVKVLAKGTINKPLIVEADDFSLQAVKMIVLTGGRVIKVCI